MNTQTKHQTEEAANFKWMHRGVPTPISQSLENFLNSKITLEKQTISEGLPGGMPEISEETDLAQLTFNWPDP